MSPASGRVFACSPGGAVAAGRRRLRNLFLALAAGLLAATLWTWSQGRIVPGLICLLVAAVLWAAWRMAGDFDGLRLVLDPAGRELTVHTRSQAVEVPLAGGARRLAPAELEHLAGLASVAGAAVPVGGFDSSLLGEFDLYASDLEHAVLVEGAERRVIVTPDDVDGFLEAIDPSPEG